MDIGEKIKEIEAKGNYIEVFKELQKYQAQLAAQYDRLGSLLAENSPSLEGILISLGEISMSAATLLRKCIIRIEDESIDTPSTDVTTSIATSTSPIPTGQTRDRDNVFTKENLREIMVEAVAIADSEKIENIPLKFWYIKEGKSEVIELSSSNKEPFVKVLLKVLDQIHASPNEKFSISPLGFEEMLRHQFESSVSKLVKLYSTEFTLIKLFM